MRLVLTLLAVTCAASVVHADTKKVEPREVVSTTAVELGSIPTFELPPMLKDAPSPPTGTEATGLTIGTVPTEVEKWRKNPMQAASFLVKGESAAFSIQLATQQNGVARDSVWISCDSRQKRPFLAVRWETFTVDVSGKATWSIHDGWIDPKACRVMRDRTTEVHPKAVASFGDHALAFAARGDDGVTFLLPSTDALAGDGSPVMARMMRGNLPRVTLPIAKGSSASAVAFVDIGRLTSWLAAIGVKDEALKVRAPRGVTVRIDATQTVSEDAPTLLVRTSASTLEIEHERGKARRLWGYSCLSPSRLPAFMFGIQPDCRANSDLLVRPFRVSEQPRHLELHGVERLEGSDIPGRDRCDEQITVRVPTQDRQRLMSDSDLPVFPPSCGFRPGFNVACSTLRCGTARATPTRAHARAPHPPVAARRPLP